MDEESGVSSDPILGDVIEALRRPVNLGDDAVTGAMARLRKESRRTHWRIHAGWAAALAASLMLAVLGLRDLGRERPAGVTFALSAPAAASVAVIGDFNDWNPTAIPLERSNAQWTVTLQLKPGRYRYSFVVDGTRWQADPATPAAMDEFGTPTSVVTVPN